MFEEPKEAEEAEQHPLPVYGEGAHVAIQTDEGSGGSGEVHGFVYSRSWSNITGDYIYTIELPRLLVGEEPNILPCMSMKSAARCDHSVILFTRSFPRPDDSDQGASLWPCSPFCSLMLPLQEMLTLGQAEPVQEGHRVSRHIEVPIARVPRKHERTRGRPAQRARLLPARGHRQSLFLAQLDI